ncbi:CIC11C00000002733 [Sungouiella intermedia]|uniref:CIC11C00000002733 n=1 Tax=Sungouiella intermedia TaxID=45354 RepID=A0A1L0C124_9ASCO|nr:CIC11C00000002733 [[Candida] intermedia]
MVVTRSGRSTRETAKKIKFTDDGEMPEQVEVFSVESTREPEEQPQEESEEESDSDSDEAPEAESISTSKQALIQKQKEQEQLKQDLRKQEREQELPDLLPEEALESDHEEETKKGKHLRSEDFEKEHAAMRKKMKLEKLRLIKEQRKAALNKGPVVVQVQSFNSKKQAPRAEKSILDSKKAWLERASLGKK